MNTIALPQFYYEYNYTGGKIIYQWIAQNVWVITHRPPDFVRSNYHFQIPLFNVSPPKDLNEEK